MTSPLEFRPLEPSLDEMVLRTFPGRRQLQCQGFVVPEGYREVADDILNMEVREDDVWVCTYPKSGTTWTEELVWCIKNDLDWKGAEVPLIKRIPFLEFSQFFHSKKSSIGDKESLTIHPRFLTHSVDVVKEMKSPRFIKTHLPWSLLPLQLQRGIVKPKIVHVFRNPMDVCISYFYHNRLMLGYKGTLEDFAFLFINDAVLCTPFWKHYFGYLETKNDFDILYLSYEDMKQDLPTAVRKTAAFLNKTLTEKQVRKLCDHLSFANMRDSPSTNNEDLVGILKQLTGSEGMVEREREGEGRFMRQGTAGQWRSKFSPEWVQRFQEWTEVNVRGTRLERILEKDFS